MFEPRPLTEDTLVELLNEGTERPGLDYKARCDLNDTRDKVAITKDIAAMMVHGGYVIIGADDNGRPTGEVTETEARLFDQATLPAKLRRYLADGFDVRCTALQVGGDRFAMICVLPHPDALAPMKGDGNYTDPDTGQTYKEFSAGDVFARHGTSSERWTAEDVRAIVGELRRQQREVAREAFREDLVALQAAQQAAGTVASGSATALDWNLAVATMTDAVIEQLRRDDTTPLLLLLKRAPRDAAGFVRACAEDELDLLLDHLTCLMATFITVERRDLASRVIAALARIYDSSFDATGMVRDQPGAITSPHLELKLVTRIWALGALATRERQWKLVRELAGHRPAVYESEYWTTWLFHGSVMAARANLLRDPDNQALGLSVLVLSQETIRRLACLRPDLDADDEQLITGSVPVRHARLLRRPRHGTRQPRRLVPGPVRAVVRATLQPAALAVIEQAEVRTAIFPHDDTEVADALVEIAQSAQSMAGFMHGWHGFDDQRIVNFISAQATRQ